MNEELITFAKNLRLLRINNKLTLRELAEAIGIGRSTLSEYENALTDPSLTHIKLIANYFDADINWLIGEVDERQKKIVD